MWISASTCWPIEAMRRHVDPHGRTWDVILGRASFGALYALFVPAAGNTESARQALLRADSQIEGEAELARLDIDELNELLERSQPKGNE